MDGSICVGTDCNNGESFGFDTIRLKENNLRIKFQDTSTTASFPSRDWQITANESENGGANKFSIDDIDGARTPFTIEAGAPSHSLYVDDGGRIGLGTSTPVVELHNKDGDTPTMRLEQDGTSGFTPQTWDVAGNETNFFIRDVTNGSTQPFKIFPDAPTNALTIEGTTGDIGLGTSSPEQDLHVFSSDGAGQVLIQEANGTTIDRPLLYLSNNGGAEIFLQNTDLTETWKLKSNGSSQFLINLADDDGGEYAGVEFKILSDGSVEAAGDITANGVLLGASDRNKKKDINPVVPEDVLDKVAGLSVSTWRYKHDKKEALHMGPMAQDFHAAFGLGSDGTHIGMLDASGVVLISIQALNDKLEAKDNEIEALKKRNEEMASRMERLESMMQKFIEEKDPVTADFLEKARSVPGLFVFSPRYSGPVQKRRFSKSPIHPASRV